MGRGTPGGVEYCIEKRPADRRKDHRPRVGAGAPYGSGEAGRRRRESEVPGGGGAPRGRGPDIEFIAAAHGSLGGVDCVHLT